MKIDIVSLVKVEWGEAQEDGGAVPAGAVQKGYTLENSFVPSIKTKGQIAVMSEDKDGVYDFVGGELDMSFGLTLLGLSFEDLSFFQGGTYNAGDYKYSLNKVYKSCRIVFKNSDDQVINWEFNRVRVFTQESGVKGKQGTQGLNIACTSLGNFKQTHLIDYGKAIGINGKVLGINNLVIGIA